MLPVAQGTASLRVLLGSRTVTSWRLRAGQPVRIRVGEWPSGLYAAELSTRNGVVRTPFVVRPRRLGENRVAVVVTAKATAAERDFLAWARRTGRGVDVLATEDLDGTSGVRLTAIYELLVFPGPRRDGRTVVRAFLARGGAVLSLSGPKLVCRLRGVAGSYTVSGSVRSAAARQQLAMFWNWLARTVKTPSGLRAVSRSEARTAAPPAARHGLAQSLRQYPAVELATPFEREEAKRLLAEIEHAAKSWRDPRAAARGGFDTSRPRRAPGETRVMWFHSEHRGNHADDAYFDPARPDTLIYADLPGRPLSLVGAMFSMPRGVEGATPGGPITRWHWHVVCTNAVKRGLKPRADGSCPPGWRLYGGSEMLHVWFTGDLRSAYAIHAPVPELCKAHLVPPRACSGHHERGM